ncbi:hypothetical protein K9U39_06105 [Rhodoblastus acidophilus]|uniref:Uncharacterized protein n=1 Tax=Candidatus Rhodoblastus alkanivorans TaxID=2954117 RepID=A0ABS9Z6B8_9HYPH|nr:hypothetical protein [Candidatus Rhodoblastus alkanivorans]MCI4680423.1 hypothetical protein [Candidatus Rhodoblastus alkanivorans]MCI4683214.1 hypothetical protein [Candidatus Rhodoblastus alkanivorans]MDI4640526.1 hypothetical protein [Rhodoblastus acidophilus]
MAKPALKRVEPQEAPAIDAAQMREKIEIIRHLEMAQESCSDLLVLADFVRAYINGRRRKSVRESGGQFYLEPGVALEFIHRTLYRLADQAAVKTDEAIQNIKASLPSDSGPQNQI